ncbi:hypothetical protein HDU93_003055, partial [Gonapodya sp. JEL0774]
STSPHQSLSSSSLQPLATGTLLTTPQSSGASSAEKNPIPPCSLANVTPYSVSATQTTPSSQTLPK